MSESEGGHSKGIRTTSLVIAVSIVLFGIYAAAWLALSKTNQVTSDYTATYVGSWLVLTGHAHQLYTYASQLMGYHLFVFHSLPTPPMSAPFVGIPLAAVIALPLTLLRADLAFYVWGTLQLALLGLACWVALRAAPSRLKRTTLESWAIVLLILSAYGTFDLLRSGQWDGLSALGLALAYRSWRKDRYATGAVLLVATGMIAKPQLGLGLLAFMVGWRNRRVLVGAIASGVAVSLASLAIIGPSQVLAYVHLVGVNAHVYDQAGQYGFIALPNAWLQDGLGDPVGYLGIIILLVLSFTVGNRLRKGRLKLGPALALASCLSMLAAPHSYTYDAVMLAPALVWLFADNSPFSTSTRSGTLIAAIVAFWFATTAVPLLDSLPLVIYRLGNPCVWFLIALTVAVWKLAHRDSQVSSPRPTPVAYSLAFK